MRTLQLGQCEAIQKIEKADALGYCCTHEKVFKTHEEFRDHLSCILILRSKTGVDWQSEKSLIYPADNYKKPKATLDLFEK